MTGYWKTLLEQKKQPCVYFQDVIVRALSWTCLANLEITVYRKLFQDWIRQNLDSSAQHERTTVCCTNTNQCWHFSSHAALFVSIDVCTE